MTMSGEEVDGNSMFNITFAVKDPVTSGSNSESINQVRQMIGLNTRSLVLANSDNYKNLINKFSFCGYNRTWSDANSTVVNSLIIKNFKNDITSGSDYFKLTEKDFILSDFQKTSIYNYIENNGGQIASVKYNIFDPDLCKYAMYVYVKLKSTSYEQDYISNKIRELIGDFFSNISCLDTFFSESMLMLSSSDNIASTSLKLVV